MGATQTQQLATVADLDGPATTAMVQALAGFSDEQKDTYLRRASSHVLSFYAKRMTLPLVTWGDFTKDLVITIARWMMIADRGYNANNPADAAVKARADMSFEALKEIVDLENKTPRMDPDVVDSTAELDEEGPLAATEGGDRDEADYWAQYTGPSASMLGTL
jgi:hypothetical protein